MTQKKLLQLWLKKLRGRSKQTTGHLRDADGYCCLGILCEAYIELGGKLNRTNEDGIYFYDGAREDLPGEVQKVIGLSTTNGGYDDEEGSTCLAEVNDDGKTFKEIAAIIESKPKGLFK